MNKERYNQCILLVFSFNTSDMHGMNIKLSLNEALSLSQVLAINISLASPVRLSGLSARQGV
jgi:hypothetical protein